MALPPRSEVRAVIGIEGMRKLMSEFGGRRVYIPVSIRRAGHLVDRLGQPLASQMVEFFGGLKLPVPRGPSEHNAVGKAIPVQMVVRLTAQGKTAPQIAEELGCTERTVHLKRAAARKPYCLATVQPNQPRKARA